MADPSTGAIQAASDTPHIRSRGDEQRQANGRPDEEQTESQKGSEHRRGGQG